jgi:hypothetical protein
MKRAMTSPILRKIFCGFLIFSLAEAQSQVTETEGDWGERLAVLYDTPEAELMVRVGDIDNLGFGWPEGYNPFSGEVARSHPYPWTADPEEPQGTDRIMVVTSYEGTPPAGRDGYTNGTSRPENSVRPVLLDFDLGSIVVENASIQMFIDDFQAPLWRANYTVTLNAEPFVEMHPLINELLQTGPVGKLVTISIPPRFLPMVQSGHLEILFDDLTTGAGDGYAIDFVKLLVNVKTFEQRGEVSGRVLSELTGSPISGAAVTVLDQVVATAADGTFLINDVPAGLVYITASAQGYETSGLHVEVEISQTTQNVELRLNPGASDLNIYNAVEMEFFGLEGLTYQLQYSADLETWEDDETIVGNNEWVIRFRSTRSTGHRYWRVLHP